MSDGSDDQLGVGDNRTGGRPMSRNEPSLGSDKRCDIFSDIYEQYTLSLIKYRIEKRFEASKALQDF